MGLGVLLWPMYLLTELQVIIMQRGMRITLHAADAQLLRQNRFRGKGHYNAWCQAGGGGGAAAEEEMSK